MCIFCDDRLSSRPRTPLVANRTALLEWIDTPADARRLLMGPTWCNPVHFATLERICDECRAVAVRNIATIEKVAYTDNWRPALYGARYETIYEKKVDRRMITGYRCVARDNITIGHGVTMAEAYADLKQKILNLAP